MAREIKGILYRIKGYSGVPHYIECESIEDLHNFVIDEWILKGYPIMSVNRMDADGTTPKVKLLTDKNFNKLLKEKRAI